MIESHLADINDQDSEGEVATVPRYCGVQPQMYQVSKKNKWFHVEGGGPMTTIGIRSTAEGESESKKSNEETIRLANIR